MKYLTISLILMMVTIGGYSQTASEIIERHIQAIGGIEKVTKEQTVHAVGNFEGTLMGAGIIETISIHNKGFRMNITKADTTRSTILYDYYRWAEENPGKKSKASRLPEQAWNSIDLDLAGEIVSYQAKGHKAEYIGVEEIEGTNCYKIRLTNSTGRVTYYFIDTSTYYIIQSSVVIIKDSKETDGGTTQFGDYRKTANGTVKPFLIRQIRNGKTIMTIKNRMIEVNKPVDMRLFERVVD